ncbi:MAG: M13 family metallopeptidase N-terminal domain-containing protein, partial [Propionibacterium sp.]
MSTTTSASTSCPAFHYEDFDRTVPPTEDLFRHVNGSWLKTATIPADKGSWGAFDKLRENSEQAVHEIIESLRSGAPEAGSEAAKVADLYVSFMDEQTVEQRGVEPLTPLFAKVDAIESVADLAAFWGWSVRHGIDALGDFDNDSDPGNPQRYLMFVSQSGIGLPDEEYYRLPEYVKTREQYLAHITRCFELAGLPDATTQAQAAYELEKDIASCHWDKVRTRDMVEMYHLQSWQEFTDATPSLEWESFLTGAELPHEAVAEVINCQRTFFTDAAPLVTTDRLDAWRSWARWQIINSLAPYLSEALSTANFDFYARTLRGVPEQRPRWKRGGDLPARGLGGAQGKLYIAAPLPPPPQTGAGD